MSQPSERRAARSAIVAFEPGSTMRSQGGIGSPGRTMTSSTPLSWAKGSRSSKFEMRGTIGTQILIGAPMLGPAPPPCRP
jgi:hypothetical protein